MNTRKRISEQVIGCAITVSNTLGAGFLEAVYERALAIEFENSALSFDRQKPLQVLYKDRIVGSYNADFVIADKLVVEVKALSNLRPEHAAQLMNYLKAGGLNAGLLLNFGTPRLGIKRIVLNYLDNEKI